MFNKYALSELSFNQRYALAVAFVLACKEDPEYVSTEGATYSEDPDAVINDACNLYALGYADYNALWAKFDTEYKKGVKQ